jgi:tellurite resistance protein TehA-like permease
MAGGQPYPGADDNKMPKLAALAILWAFLFPPAALIYAARCLGEANRLNVAKTLALVAGGFAAFGLILHSTLFAIITGDTFLVIRG